MISEIFDYLSQILYQKFEYALFASFVWGVLSVLLSPCHLSSIPLVVGFINAQLNLTTKKSFNLSLVFALGILITIAIIGFITAYLGRLIGDIGIIGSYFVALIFFIVGLYFLDIINLSWLGINIKGTKYKGWLAALVLGLLFGIGLGPCTFAFMAPVLSVVFEIAKTNIFNAILLILLFALGHCFVIVLAGTLAGKLQSYLNWSENSKSIKYIKKTCGILIIFAGLYMIYITF